MWAEIFSCLINVLPNKATTNPTMTANEIDRDGNRCVSGDIHLLPY